MSYQKELDTNEHFSLKTNNSYLAITNLSRLIHLRFTLYFKTEEAISETDIRFPMIYDDGSHFASFNQKYQPAFEEYIILIMALVPHLKIDFYDELWKEHLSKEGEFPIIGGTRDKKSRTFLPTIETAFFILAGDDLEKRFEVQQIFTSDHWLFKNHILFLDKAAPTSPFSSSGIYMNPEYVELFTIGKTTRPSLSITFPAKHLVSEQNWEDLVLSQKTLGQIEEIKIWLQYNQTLLEDWGMKKKIKPGYRVLFHGPPGTGKTLTATLLGKEHQRDVFRIDLSLIVSKYIGETEKNLSQLFNKAQNKDWILFFDEADALFGKRTDVRDAHDKYANQEVAYLLQRIENYPGLVILATNFKSNIDEAFVRRFQSIVHFPIPKTAERLLLWKKAFPAKIQLAEEIDLPAIARQFELTGSNIINIVEYTCLKVIAAQTTTLSKTLLLDGINREYRKEGKLL